MNEKVAAKLVQIVGEGIVEIKQVYNYYTYDVILKTCQVMPVLHIQT